jgi:hypothetical protein
MGFGGVHPRPPSETAVPTFHIDITDVSDLIRKLCRDFHEQWHKAELHSTQKN